MSDPTIRNPATAATTSIACAACGATMGTMMSVCPKCGATARDGYTAEQNEKLVAKLQEAIGDGYRLLELLGRGGMGIVFRAHETALDREVALKVLAIDPVFAPDAYARFEREAKLAARLDHPGIVPIFAVGSHASTAYYTMRLVRGGSVEELLAQRKQLDVGRVLAILREVAAALDYAHRQGVVHRDIKPANILLSDTGHASVADFGIAKALGPQGGATGTGVIGSPAYMSPEQWRADASIDGRADQYALAVVAFEMLAGRRPFASAHVQDLLKAHLNGEVPDICTLRPELDASAGEAIRRAMSKHANQRFGTVTAFVESLAGRRPTMQTQRGPRYTAPPPRKKRRGGLIALMLLVAAATAAALAPQTRPHVQRLVDLGGAHVDTILSGFRPTTPLAESTPRASAGDLSVAPAGEVVPVDSTPIEVPELLAHADDAAHAIVTPERPPVGLDTALYGPASAAFRSVPSASVGYVRVIVRGGAAPVMLDGQTMGMTAGPEGAVLRTDVGTHYVTVRGAGDLFLPSQITVRVTANDTTLAVFATPALARPPLDSARARQAAAPPPRAPVQRARPDSVASDTAAPPSPSADSTPPR